MDHLAIGMSTRTTDNLCPPHVQFWLTACKDASTNDEIRERDVHLDCEESTCGQSGHRGAIFVDIVRLQRIGVGSGSVCKCTVPDEQEEGEAVEAHDEIICARCSGFPERFSAAL